METKPMVGRTFQATIEELEREIELQNKTVMLAKYRMDAAPLFTPESWIAIQMFDLELEKLKIMQIQLYKTKKGMSK